MKKTLLLCAMSEELEVLRDSLNLQKDSSNPNLPWPIYKHPDLNIYASITGIGKVNAAACCSALIVSLKPDQVIGIGVAGGVSPELKIGDIVISNNALQYDMDVTAFGYDLGHVPGMKNKTYPASEGLYKKALRISESLDLNVHTTIGTIMSGDCFVSGSRGSEIYDIFGGKCVDMESAAWAQVAHIFNVPWLVLRSMSDQADGKASIDFDQFLPHAVRNLSMLVEALIKEV